jgi:O-6-methylguanine DNA methyltransferase
MSLRLMRRTFQTPVGPMMALASADGLCALEFWSPTRMSRLEHRLRRWFPPHEIADGTSATLEQTGAWLAAYFAGDAVADPPLDMRGAGFERRVWQALLTIPRGATASYGAIARQLDAPGASRAVGLANGANPVAVIVPCHRVIGSNGALTGYGGGLERKAWLLNHEQRCWGRAGSGSVAVDGRLPLDG